MPGLEREISAVYKGGRENKRTYESLEELIAAYTHEDGKYGHAEEEDRDVCVWHWHCGDMVFLWVACVDD